MPTRLSTSTGDMQARRLRQQIVEILKRKIGLDVPEKQTLDQLVRHAAKAGIGLTIGEMK
ncbi:hypothetical protein D3C75_1030100 [compost metagenome]